MVSSIALGPAHRGAPADLVGDLHLHRDADLTRHLPGHLLRHLLTLPVHLLVTLGTTGVSSISGLSLSFPLAVVTSLDNLGVMTNNSAAVVHLGVGLLALSGEGLLALLDVGGVHNGLAHGPGHLTLVLLGDLVALSVLLLVTLGTTGVTTIARLSIRLGLSVSLAVSVTMRHNLRVVTNNSGGVADLLGDGVAVLGHNVFAFLNVGGVHNGVIDLVANLPGHLALVLLGDLVALSVNLLLALWTAGVTTIAGFSIRLGLGVPLAVSVTMGDNLGVVTNNSRAVVNLLGDRVAVLGHDVLTLLNVGGVHNGVILLVANLSWHLALVLLGDLVALSVNLIVTLGSARVSSIAWLSIRLGLSIPLAVSVTMGDNLGVVTNNSGALVNLLGDGVAVFSDDILALLDVGGVNNHVVLLVTLLPLVLDGLLVTLLVWLAEALEVVVFAVSGLSLSLGDSRQTGSRDAEDEDS